MSRFDENPIVSDLLWAKAEHEEEDVEVFTFEELATDYDRLRAALETIAGGHTDRFPGAPDVMAESPDTFRHKMWPWI